MDSYTSALAALFLVSACRTESPYALDEEDVHRYATARCAAVLECCGAPAEPDCAESLADMILDAESLLGVELSFSETCMTDLVAYSQSIGCDRDATGSPECRLAVGGGDYGEECEEFDDGLAFYITTCRDGLQCHAGRCVDQIFDNTQPAQLGENCSPFTLCDQNLYCDPNSKCSEAIRAGEECTEQQVCERGHYCHGYLEGRGSCEENLGLGDECDPKYEDACGYDFDVDGSLRLTHCAEGACSFFGSPVCEDVQ